MKQSIHSSDFGYIRKANLTQEEFEEKRGINNIREALKTLGWETWQWRNCTKTDLKKYPSFTNFVEAFGKNYNGYLRGDSRKSLKDACNQILNRAQKMAQCEMKGSGHVYRSMKGYENGMINCSKCGFWGYNNIFSHMNRDLSSIKFEINHIKKEFGTFRENIRILGFGSNLCAKALFIEKPLSKAGIIINESPKTEKYYQDLKKLLIKHKLMEKENGKK